MPTLITDDAKLREALSDVMFYGASSANQQKLISLKPVPHHPPFALIFEQVRVDNLNVKAMLSGYPSKDRDLYILIKRYYDEKVQISVNLMLDIDSFVIEAFRKWVPDIGYPRTCRNKYRVTCNEIVDYGHGFEKKVVSIQNCKTNEAHTMTVYEWKKWSQDKKVSLEIMAQIIEIIFQENSKQFLGSTKDTQLAINGLDNRDGRPRTFLVLFMLRIMNTKHMRVNEKTALQFFEIETQRKWQISARQADLIDRYKDYLASNSWSHWDYFNTPPTCLNGIIDGSNGSSKGREDTSRLQKRRRKLPLPPRTAH